MAGPVKTPRRPYRSPKHEAMRQATRQSVIAAARRLFGERGYAATSIEAVAAAAGVAVPTVYAAFGNKRSILRALIDAAVDGTERSRPVAERLRDQLTGAADPATRVQQMMRLAISLIAQAADVQRILRGAAATDPEIQSLLDEAHDRIYTDCQTGAGLVIGVASDNARTRRLADVIFAVTSSDLFDLLTQTRGWSVAEYERWAIQTVTAELPGPRSLTGAGGSATTTDDGPPDRHADKPAAPGGRADAGQALYEGPQPGRDAAAAAFRAGPVAENPAGIDEPFSPDAKEER
jgi:AcrR family transcriptional regulator